MTDSSGSYGEPSGRGTGAHSVYAGFWPSGSIDGRSVVPAASAADGSGARQHFTEHRENRVRPGAFGAILEAWLPFSAWIVDRFIGPRAPTAPWQSVYDFPGERIQRQGTFPSGQRPFPYPYEIGAVSGFMPMLDQYSLAWAWGKTPSGPGVLTPVPIPYQASYPNLQKVTG